MSSPASRRTSPTLAARASSLSPSEANSAVGGGVVGHGQGARDERLLLGARGRSVRRPRSITRRAIGTLMVDHAEPSCTAAQHHGLSRAGRSHDEPDLARRALPPTCRRRPRLRRRAPCAVAGASARVSARRGALAASRVGAGEPRPAPVRGRGARGRADWPQPTAGTAMAAAESRIRVRTESDAIRRSGRSAGRTLPGPAGRAGEGRRSERLQTLGSIVRGSMAVAGWSGAGGFSRPTATDHERTGGSESGPRRRTRSRESGAPLPLLRSSPSWAP